MPRGRKRKVALNMKAASGMLGLDRSTIQKAKALGCPAWDESGRINLPVLQKWIAENESKLAEAAGTDSKLAYEIRRLKAQCVGIELRNKIASGELIRGKLVQDSFGKFGAELISTLRQKLENEYPHRFAGLDIPGIRKLSKGICDELVMIIFEEARKWDVEINADNLPASP